MSTKPIKLGLIVVSSFLASINAERTHTIALSNNSGHSSDNINDLATLKTERTIEDFGCGNGFLFGLKLRTDGYAEETSWKLTHQYGSVVASQGEKPLADKTVYSYKECLPHGCYTFQISDSFGDGISQHTNNGSYKGYVNEKEEFYGGEFLSLATNAFCTGEFSTGCSDGGSEFEFKLVLQSDGFGSETAWDLRDSKNTPIYYKPLLESNNEYSEKKILPGGCYTFNLYDSWGDGFCCSHGDGSATGYVDDKVTFNVKSFGSVFTSSFCNCGNFPSLAPTVIPTVKPSRLPSAFPSAPPSDTPTLVPTMIPSNYPSIEPSVIPSGSPTTAPPTRKPTSRPTENTYPPSAQPSQSHSDTPSQNPSITCGTNQFVLQIEEVPTMDKIEDTTADDDDFVVVGDDMVMAGGLFMIPLETIELRKSKSMNPANKWNLLDSAGNMIYTEESQNSSPQNRVSDGSGVPVGYQCFRKGCYTFKFSEDEGIGLMGGLDGGNFQPETELIGFAAGKPVAFTNGADGSKSFCSTGCNSNEFFFEFELMTDRWSNETSWDVRDSSHQIIEGKPPKTYTQSSTLYTENRCYPKGCYTFYVYDTWGDGFCCDYGQGYVELFVDGVATFKEQAFTKTLGYFFCG